MIFNLDGWLKWPFDLPPIKEQRRIAEILSTWDKAIAVQEKLVANAKANKKALMQQLLTGKKRLPGFKGEWKETSWSTLPSIRWWYSFNGQCRSTGAGPYPGLVHAK